MARQPKYAESFFEISSTGIFDKKVSEKLFKEYTPDTIYSSTWHVLLKTVHKPPDTFYEYLPYTNITKFERFPANLVSVDCIKALSVNLNCTKIDSLCIYGHTFESGTLSILGQGLPGSAVSCVDLEESIYSEEDIIALFKSFKNSNIKILDLASATELPAPEEFSHLINSKLRSLYLSQSGFDAGQITDLVSRLIGSNINLLWLEGTDLNNLNAPQFIAVLNKTNIEALNIGSCLIADEVAISLVKELIKNNGKLKTLDLSSNGISANGKKEINDLVQASDLKLIMPYEDEEENTEDSEDDTEDDDNDDVHDIEGEEYHDDN